MCIEYAATNLLVEPFSLALSPGLRKKGKKEIKRTKNNATTRPTPSRNLGLPSSLRENAMGIRQVHLLDILL